MRRKVPFVGDMPLPEPARAAVAGHARTLPSNSYETLNARKQPLDFKRPDFLSTVDTPAPHSAATFAFPANISGSAASIQPVSATTCPAACRPSGVSS